MKGSFSDFNKIFYQSFNDLKVFNCQDINIIKVVQDGLSVNYSGKTLFGKPLWLIRIYEYTKRVKSFFLGKRSKLDNWRHTDRDQRILIIDKPRYSVDDFNNFVSLYFHNIINIIGRENCFYILENDKALNENEMIYDLTTYKYFTNYFYLKLSNDEKLLYRNLKSTFNRIKRNTTFNKNDIQRIGYAIWLFWRNYRVWNYLLDNSRFEYCYFICHYHKEGCLLALKRHGIVSIELQHGLIAREDIFYIYPQAVQNIARKSLFADYIGVYGDYWKDVLSKGYEYPEDRVVIVGYFLYENRKSDETTIHSIKNTIPSNAKIILVTTQTGLHTHFIQYIKWLSNDIVSRKANIFVLVKPHPAEDMGIYDAINELPNVSVVSTSITRLYMLADIVISIYSTTLFEAKRFDLACYSLNVEEYRDYVTGIAQTGIASIIEMQENPLLDLNEAESQQAQSDYYFKPFRSDLLPHYLLERRALLPK